MKPRVKIFVGMAILLGGIGVAVLLIKTKPKADEREAARNPPPVEVMVARRADFPIEIVTQGELLPVRETAISAEVGGRVASVAPRLKVGERFGVGEVLLEIDAADYRAASAHAEADVANARLALARERAMASQALRDWKRLGSKPEAEAGELVLRKPQLLSAEAGLAAAEAAREKAGRDLERATVRAPYACQIRATHTEIGAFVGPGSPLVEVFSTGALEVRLAVALEDFAYVKTGAGKVPVRLSATIGREELHWDGEILRTEGQVDRASRSVFLVARVSPDGGDARAARFLVPGLFVRAEVDAGTLPGVFRLPRKALYGKDRILIVGEGDRVAFRTVKILRSSSEDVVVGGGLEPGERVAVSPLPQVIEQMRVRVGSD